MLNATDAHIEQPAEDFGDVRNRSLRITLPHQPPLARVSVDIGGSLAKVVYFQDGSLHFVSFQSSSIDELLAFLRPLTADLATAGEPVVLHATGGGALKYRETLAKELKVNVIGFDEIESLIEGSTFFRSQIPNEVFAWDSSLADPMKVVAKNGSLKEPVYPYMMVNIGSGVGFIKVEGPYKFERVGGSALGGGTLWGLLATLTSAQDFDEMLRMAAQGDSTNVDMLVGDIYGSGYPRMGLSASTTASFFAKAFKEKEKRQEFESADICKSLLVAVSYNIAQLAYLHARFYGIENIYFAGSYIRGHSQTIETLANGIRYWSKGDKSAYFFRHEGYLGALGAFLSS